MDFGEKTFTPGCSGCQRKYCKGFALVLKHKKRAVLLSSLSFQVATFRRGDVERVGGGEEVSLVRGAVVVRRQVRVQEGGECKVGGAFFQAVGVQVEKEVQFVLYRLNLNKHTNCIRPPWKARNPCQVFFRMQGYFILFIIYIRNHSPANTI